MAATGRFIDATDVEDFLGPAPYKRIYDDDDVGGAKERPVQLLIEDAEAEVFGAAICNYPEENLPSTPTEAKTTKGGQLLRTIALRMVRAYALDRYPEIARRDPAPIVRAAEKLVEKLRESKIVLHGLAADPANVGGEVISDDTLLDEPKQFWLNDGGTGIF